MVQRGEVYGLGPEPVLGRFLCRGSQSRLYDGCYKDFYLTDTCRYDGDVGIKCEGTSFSMISGCEGFSIINFYTPDHTPLLLYLSL